MAPPDQPISQGLPPVTVDTDAALDRTRVRGRRRQRRRTAVVGAAAVGLIVLITAVAVAATRDEGQGVIADAPDESATTTAVPRPEGDLALWRVDPERPPEAGATSFVALVSRVGCHDGVTGEVRGPGIDERDADVVVTFAVAPAEGDFTCPGNDEVAVEVELAEPIGDRLLRDGGCPLDPRGGSGCVVDDGTTEGARSDVRWPEGARIEPHECEAPEGTALDVAHEGNGRQYADWQTVTDVDGCLVRIDALGVRTGADHCGWGAALVLVTGDPIGTPGDGTNVHYVRDPDGVYGDPDLAAGFAEDVDLPPDAEPTGFLLDGDRPIWVDPDDSSAVYVFAEDTVLERWPRGTEPLCS